MPKVPLCVVFLYSGGRFIKTQSWRNLRIYHRHNGCYAYPVIMICICPCFVSWWSCNGIFHSQASPTLPLHIDQFMLARIIVSSSRAHLYIPSISYPCCYPPISIHLPLSLYIHSTLCIYCIQFGSNPTRAAPFFTQFQPVLAENRRRWTRVVKEIVTGYVYTWLCAWCSTIIISNFVDWYRSQHALSITPPSFTSAHTLL